MDCKGWCLGSHPAVVAQWQSTGGSSQRGFFGSTPSNCWPIHFPLFLPYGIYLNAFINHSTNFQELSPRLLLHKFFGQLGLLVNHSTSSQAIWAACACKFYTKSHLAKLYN